MFEKIYAHKSMPNSVKIGMLPAPVNRPFVAVGDLKSYIQILCPSEDDTKVFF